MTFPNPENTMRLPTVISLLALLAAPAALASNVQTFPIDPYNSKGLFENVRYIAVDPAEAVKILKPVAPLATPAPAGETATLPIFNGTATFVNLYVNGLRIGDIESLDTVVLKGLTPGVYDVLTVRPNGFREAWKMSTDPKTAPVPIIPAPEMKPAPSVIGPPAH